MRTSASPPVAGIRNRPVAGSLVANTIVSSEPRYLLAVSAMPTFAERRAHIRLWVTQFGHRRRDTIATNEIDAVLNRWLIEGLAASTVKHRRTALLHLWHRLDGKEAANHRPAESDAA